MGLRKNVMREGDLVEVINPQAFDRCGYPNPLQHYIDLAEKQYYKDFSKFRNADRVFHEIGYGMACADRFGGPDRTVHLKEGPFPIGTKLKVAYTRLVKTGVYYPPTGGTSWNSYDDYEPGGLADSQTHIVVAVRNVDGFSIDGFKLARMARWKEKPDSRQLEYLSTHLRKVDLNE